jgi:hypothetical protein
LAGRGEILHGLLELPHVETDVIDGMRDRLGSHSRQMNCQIEMATEGFVKRSTGNPSNCR